LIYDGCMNNADNQSIWWKLVGILIFVIVGIWLGWGYLAFQNTDMSTLWFASIPNKAGEIKKLNDTLTDKNDELILLKQSNEAVKYEIADHIENNIEHPIWSDYINSLIQMYKEVRDIGKYSPDAIELSDFVVDQQRIGLRGKVRRLDTIYVENGVIDRLTRLNFLSNIQIPSYQKIDDVYEFQIQWEVSSAKK